MPESRDTEGQEQIPEKPSKVCNFDFFFDDLTSTKVVIFSQWTSMLDLLESAINQKYQSPHQTDQPNKRQRTSLNLFEDHPIKVIRFDGSMSQSQRSSAIEVFYDDPRAKIFLVSLKFHLVV